MTLKIVLFVSVLLATATHQALGDHDPVQLRKDFEKDMNNNKTGLVGVICLPRPKDKDGNVTLLYVRKDLLCYEGDSPSPIRHVKVSASIFGHKPLEAYFPELEHLEGGKEFLKVMRNATSISVASLAASEQQVYAMFRIETEPDSSEWHILNIIEHKVVNIATGQFQMPFRNLTSQDMRLIVSKCDSKSEFFLQEKERKTYIYVAIPKIEQGQMVNLSIGVKLELTIINKTHMNFRDRTEVPDGEGSKEGRKESNKAAFRNGYLYQNEIVLVDDQNKILKIPYVWTKVEHYRAFRFKQLKFSEFFNFPNRSHDEQPPLEGKLSFVLNLNLTLLLLETSKIRIIAIVVVIIIIIIVIVVIYLVFCRKKQQEEPRSTALKSEVDSKLPQEGAKKMSQNAKNLNSSVISVKRSDLRMPTTRSEVFTKKAGKSSVSKSASKVSSSQAKSQSSSKVSASKAGSKPSSTQSKSGAKK